MKILDVPKAILLLLAQSEGGSDWPALETISRSLPPVAPFEANMLPSALRPWVVDVAHRMQCPLDYVAVAATVMIASIVGTGCTIRPKQKDNWTVVPNLWGAIVGRPGRLKSPALSSAMAPLYRLEQHAQADYSAAMAQYVVAELARELDVKLKTKTLEKQPTLATPDRLDELARLNNLAGAKPELRRFIANDSTVEKLGEILSHNPRGLLILRDELMGLLEGFERLGREGERQFYLEAWNGTQPFHVDRVSRGHIWIERLCASLFGGIQPGMLENYIYQTQGSSNDGFIQRFQLLAFPDEAEGFVVIDQAPDDAARDIVQRLAERLAHCDYVALGAKQEVAEAAPYFRFEADAAQPLFFSWMTDLEQRIRNEDMPMMAEHLGKYRKLVPALALVFHLVDLASMLVAPIIPAAPAVKSRKLKHAPPEGVSIENLQRAIQWADYLETHARRVYAMGTDHRIQAAQALAKKLSNGQLQDGFSARDIGRNNWSMLKDPDEVKAACDELEAAGWIRRLPKVAHDRAGGRPPLPKYEINPAINSSAGGAPPKPTKPARKKRP